METLQSINGSLLIVALGISCCRGRLLLLLLLFQTTFFRKRSLVCFVFSLQSVLEGNFKTSKLSVYLLSAFGDLFLGLNQTKDQRSKVLLLLFFPSKFFVCFIRVSLFRAEFPKLLCVCLKVLDWIGRRRSRRRRRIAC